MRFIVSTVCLLLFVGLELAAFAENKTPTLTAPVLPPDQKGFIPPPDRNDSFLPPSDLPPPKNAVEVQAKKEETAAAAPVPAGFAITVKGDVGSDGTLSFATKLPKDSAGKYLLVFLQPVALTQDPQLVPAIEDHITNAQAAASDVASSIPLPRITTLEGGNATILPGKFNLRAALYAKRPLKGKALNPNVESITTVESGFFQIKGQ